MFSLLSSSLFPFAALDVNFFQKVLDFLSSIGEFIRTIGAQVLSGIRVMLGLYPLLISALTVPGQMEIGVPPVVTLVAGVGVTVALAAIILPGFIGGRK
mgnify:FL=1